MRKGKILNTIFYIGTGLFLMAISSNPLTYYLGVILFMLGGWSIPEIFKRNYVAGAVRKAYCIYCEAHKVTIIIKQTPKGKVYEWFCSNCKKHTEE